jgi:hypothetical protein
LIADSAHIVEVTKNLVKFFPKTDTFISKIEISSSFPNASLSPHPRGTLEEFCNKQGSHKNLIFYIKRQGKCISHIWTWTRQKYPRVIFNFIQNLLKNYTIIKTRQILSDVLLNEGLFSFLFVVNVFV